MSARVAEAGTVTLGGSELVERRAAALPCAPADVVGAARDLLARQLVVGEPVALERRDSACPCRSGLKFKKCHGR